MNAFKIKFTSSSSKGETKECTFSGVTNASSFSVELETMIDDDIFDGYQMSLPQKSNFPYLNSGKQENNDNQIFWHASHSSKFKKRISFEIERDINLEFVNGDNHLYLHWENGAVTSLKKEYIESMLFLRATNGRLGVVQCTIYENILDNGMGPAVFRTYIDETHPLNEDIAEISKLLSEAGFEVIGD